MAEEGDGIGGLDESALDDALMTEPATKPKPAPIIEFKADKPGVKIKPAPIVTACSESKCVCRCVTNASNLKATRGKPTFAGFKEADACVCPCVLKPEIDTE